ncbi:hypothetical protein [Phnomibacter sp. MR]|uniref:hypothetical protein n=1 Tax=Phnomibacter sp. MR TaxID=3042318 RepID=UPI003A80B8D4
MAYIHPTYESCFDHLQAQDIVQAIIQLIRPGQVKRISQAEAKLDDFTAWLQQHEDYRLRLREAITHLVADSDLTYTFAESGLLAGSSFFAEFNRRLTDKFLPHLLPHNDLRIHIRKVFYRSNDYKWMQQINSSSWINLLNVLQLDIVLQDAAHLQQLTDAGEQVSLRLAAMGIDSRMTQHYGEVLQPVNAFTEQYAAWSRFKDEILHPESAANIPAAFSRLTQAIDAAIRQVKEVRRLKKTKGTSLQQTFLIARMQQQLERLQIIATILDPATDVSMPLNVQFWLRLVANENTQNRLRSLFSSNVSFLAYQIAEHSSKTGEKYISNNSKEYKQFIGAAAVGGVIISVAALIKVGLTNLHLPYFWASFSYGFNYALAFVIIHFVHGTIATKQPALTASTLANAIGNDATNAQQIAPLIAQVGRSQFASLIGNLMIVAPLTMLIGWGFHALFGTHVVDATSAPLLLQDVQLSIRNIWYAAIAGVLLFGSGIISGYFDNLVIFGNIPTRIKHHKKLRGLLGEKTTNKLAHYIEKNLGAIMGNVLLGFGLGFMIFFGKILGIPLDIRHVTISTGFFGFSSVGLDFHLTLSQLLWALAGLMGIAFTNLAVSFALALYVAMKSRGIATVELGPIVSTTLRHFIKHPLHFFIPPRRSKKAKLAAGALADQSLK